MTNELLAKLAEFLANRRPFWTFYLEDEVLRVMSHQFLIDWRVILEICKLYKLEVVEVLSHATNGVVVTMRMPEAEGK